VLFNCCSTVAQEVPDATISCPNQNHSRNESPRYTYPGRQCSLSAWRLRAAGALLQVAWADESRLGKPDSDTGDLNTARILEHGNGPQSCSSFVTFRCRMSQLCG